MLRWMQFAYDLANVWKLSQRAEKNGKIQTSLNEPQGKIEK